MKALAIPLERPVGTGAIYLALLLLGLAALQHLPLGLSPDVELPRITLQLMWPNASPEDMEALVTAPVEGEAHRLPGVNAIRSMSSRGFAMIVIEYERGASMDRAELLLRDRLTALAPLLPADLEPPVLERARPAEREAEDDFMILQVAGPRTANSLREVLEEIAVPVFLAVPGVAQAEVYGGSIRELRVEVDPDALERGWVVMGDLTARLDKVGDDVPLGSVPAGGARVPVVVRRDAPRAEALRAGIVGGSRDRAVRLDEVAAVYDAWREPEQLARIDGRPSVQLVIGREPGTNLIGVATGIREAMEEVEALLPPDLDIEIVHDQSRAIRRELSLLTQRAGLSVLCIFTVLLLSQGRVRSSLAVLASVLFSAVITFLLFRWVGLGIDLVTLSGLALAFGMAVDNSIVILENIALRTRGTGTRLRTLAAMREVQFPLLAGALTTVVVLTPFLYLTGELREYYLPFVMAVSLSLAASLGVAFTLTPLLARWSLAPASRLEILVSRRGAAGLRAVEVFYADALGRSLRWRWLTVALAVLVFAGSIQVFREKVSRGSIFPRDPDTVLFVSVGMPPGADLARTESLLLPFEQAVLEHPYYAAGYIEQVRTRMTAARGMVIVRFHPAVARTAIPGELKEEMVVRAALVAGASISVQGQGPGYSAGGGSVSASYSLSLRGPDYLALGELAENLARGLERHPRITEVNANASSWLGEDAIEFTLSPRRPALSVLGVPVRDLVSVVEPAVAGRVADRVLRGPDGDLTGSVRLAGGDALTPETLRNTVARTGAGVAYPVGEVVDIEPRAVQREIHRRDQQYERLLAFEFRGPRRVGDRFVRGFVEATQVPEGYLLEEGRALYLTTRQQRDIALALGAAIVLIFMVSAALFESLVLPFVALVSVPLSFIGVPFAFWLTDTSFDRTAYIGLILLAGIAINNALLLVHRAGVLHRVTRDVGRSIRQASRERLRPILLTTATSVAGLAPLAWGGDPTGAAGWRTLALSATAGLLTAAAITLWVVPPLFTLLVRRRPSPGVAPDLSRSGPERTR